jgi:hypothetical protein
MKFEGPPQQLEGESGCICVVEKPFLQMDASYTCSTIRGFCGDFARDWSELTVAVLVVQLLAQSQPSSRWLCQNGVFDDLLHTVST